ncbi:MAG: ABC transporter ATP-binding protein [Lachnospiraceae bacterium]|nr:ABC transporter ATP-binding protein [Lachnospiraceae bacterium]
MIEVSHLTKRYGDHEAVKDISFTVEKGRIYGFLGPNGAGKSTTMNIITGCLSATEGTVTINGHDIFEEPKEAKKSIGYLPEQPPVYLEETIEEYLTFVASAKKIPKKEIRAEVERVMEATGTTIFRNRLIKNLSKGYRQRVGIAQALLGDPEIIILDEPTVGLDPMQIIEIRDLISGLKDTHTVILSSHILSEVQEICQIIIMIAHGKLIACDTPENLQRQFAGDLKVEIRADASEAAVLEVLKDIPDIDDVKFEKVDDRAVSAVISTKLENSRSLNTALFKAFSEAGITLFELKTLQSDLEDIFIELTNQADVEYAEEEERRSGEQ